MKSSTAPTSSGRAHDGDDGPAARMTPQIAAATLAAAPEASPASPTPVRPDSSGSAVPDDHQEAREREWAELAAAIAMVADGFATRVVLVGLRAPEAAVAALSMTAAGRGVSLRLLTPTQDGNVSAVAQRA